jgi:hypothetical protein
MKVRAHIGVLRAGTFLSLLAIVTFAGFVPAHSSTLGADSGTLLAQSFGDDPSDIPGRTAMDVLRSQRARVLLDGVHTIRFRVMAEQSFRDARGYNEGLLIHLDSRRGPRADYALDIFLGDAGSDMSPGCMLVRNGRHRPLWGALSQPRFWPAGAISCTIHRGVLHATHPIRWRIASAEGWLQPGAYATAVDRAPNRGFFE